MKDFSISAIFTALAESPNRSSKSKQFWKSPRKEKTLLKNGGILMCNNFEDAEVLNNLISQKVKSLKTVENVYIKDTTPFSNIILRASKSDSNIILNDDTYAEVFDSLNKLLEDDEDIPPPLPSKKSSPKPPARPPYPSSHLQKRDTRTV